MASPCPWHPQRRSPAAGEEHHGWQKWDQTTAGQLELPQAAFSASCHCMWAKDPLTVPSLFPHAPRAVPGPRPAPRQPRSIPSPSAQHPKSQELAWWPPRCSPQPSQVPRQLSRLLSAKRLINEVEKEEEEQAEWSLLRDSAARRRRRALSIDLRISSHPRGEGVPGKQRGGKAEGAAWGVGASRCGQQFSPQGHSPTRSTAPPKAGGKGDRGAGGPGPGVPRASQSLPWSSAVSIPQGTSPRLSAAAPHSSAGEGRGGGGRGTGWAVWEGRSSPAQPFPVSKLSLQGLAVVPVGSTARGLEEPPTPGHQPWLGSSPRSGAVHTSHPWQCQTLPGSHGRGRFPAPAHSSRQRTGDTRVTGPHGQKLLQL